MGGAIMPPTAHSIGTAAALGLDSDPVVSSCFNSRPTVRKNTVSRPSCTQWPNPMSILVCGMAIRKFSSCSNACAVNGRLASNRPARAKPSIIRPDMRSDAAMRRIVAQVPLFDVAIMLLVLRSPLSVNVVSSVSEGLGVHPCRILRSAVRAINCRLHKNPRKIKKASSAFAKEVHVRETGFEPATC